MNVDDQYLGNETKQATWIHVDDCAAIPLYVALYGFNSFNELKYY